MIEGGKGPPTLFRGTCTGPGRGNAIASSRQGLAGEGNVSTARKRRGGNSEGRRRDTSGSLARSWAVGCSVAARAGPPAAEGGGVSGRGVGVHGRSVLGPCLAGGGRRRFKRLSAML